MLMFFMLGGALRAAGDARTPLRLGVAMTVLNIVLNVVLIRGAGPDPGVRHARRGDGHGDREHLGLGASASGCSSPAGSSCTSSARCRWRPTSTIIRSLFRFGLPAGIQGVAMNVGGVLLLRFIGSLPAQRRSAGGVRGRLRGAVLADHVDVGRADGRRGRGRRPEPRRRQARSQRARRAPRGAHRPWRRRRRSARCSCSSRSSCSAIFGLNDPSSCELGRELLRFLSVSGLFITVALTYTGGLQGTGDTRSPLYITLVSQVLLPLGICFAAAAPGQLHASGVWTAILVGHSTRCLLSVARFQQGKWRHIQV